MYRISLYYAVSAGKSRYAEYPGGSTVRSLLSIGLGVMGVFSLIFLLYSNSFVMKRRQTEFGLYNILGMEKRHISQMLLAETLITGAASLSAGILAGIVSVNWRFCCF